MQNLSRALPKNITAFHGADSAAIRDMVLDLARPGDVIMIKGSYGSRMIPIAEALRALDQSNTPGAAATGRA
jgi:UDP-N-acetylmuramyl pentapeptide synthase